MFSEFLNNGNIVALVLMAYTNNVMIEAMGLSMKKFDAPPILNNPIATIFMFGGLPCTIWPAIYIGLFYGWVAGVIAWIGLQILGVIATVVLGIRGPFTAVHFLVACVAYPIGYYLSFSNMPAKLAAAARESELAASYTVFILPSILVLFAIVLNWTKIKQWLMR